MLRILSKMEGTRSCSELSVPVATSCRRYWTDGPNPTPVSRPRLGSPVTFTRAPVAWRLVRLVAFGSTVFQRKPEPNATQSRCRRRLAVRFGVSLFDGATGAVREPVAKARETGIDTVLCADHLGMAAPFSTLAYAAALDETIGLATFVVNQDFWNPVLLAREAASLAAISKGRFTLVSAPGIWLTRTSGPGCRSTRTRSGRPGWVRGWPPCAPNCRPGPRRPAHPRGRQRSVGAEPRRRHRRCRGPGRIHARRGWGGSGRTLVQLVGNPFAVQIVRAAAVAAGRPVPPLNSLIQGVVITDDRAGTAACLIAEPPP